MRATETRQAFHILSAISWIILVTVMFGGYSLLRLLTTIGISEHEEQFFRAGHGHAGILVAVGILYAHSASKTLLPFRRQVIAFALYLVGALIVSGGFFVHMVFGQAGQSSFGTSVMAPVGSLLIAVAVVFLAVHLIRTPGTNEPTVPRVAADT